MEVFDDRYEILLESDLVLSVLHGEITDEEYALLSRLLELANYLEARLDSSEEMLSRVVQGDY